MQVVDLLEAVEIDAEHREDGVAALRVPEQLAEVLVERGTVGKIGERVVHRAARNGAFGAVALRHVDDRHHDGDPTTDRIDRLSVCLHLDHAAVGLDVVPGAAVTVRIVARQGACA